MSNNQDEDLDLGKQLAQAFESDLAEVDSTASDTNSDDDSDDDKDKKDDSSDKSLKTDKQDADSDKNENQTNQDQHQDVDQDTTQTTDADAEKVDEVQPLTKQDVADLISQMRNDDRISSSELENQTNDVIESYYPKGLSNVLVDQSTGKELRTPKDVVEASNNEMSMEEAAQWLMNEQYKLDKNIEKIKEDARTVAETTLTFRKNSMAALEKYQPLFKAYPKLQARVFDRMMKNVKSDVQKGVILSSPDPLEFYDDYLEPYQKAFEYAQQHQTQTAPEPKPTPKPGTDDRLDEGGDGGTSEVDDPNDFAQQVKKELGKGM